MTAVITTYLQDHHAGASAGIDAFQRVADSHGDPAVRQAISHMVTEIKRDEESLRSIMDAFGAKTSPLKDIPARIAEKAARLKPNERISKRSPLSDVVELEALVLAVHGKSLGWQALLELDDPGLDRSELGRLLDRAHQQRDELEELWKSQLGKLSQD